MVQEVIKTIIIDDEFPARKLLSEYASKIANIKLCGVCDNAVHALELLQNEEVDLIFTDIQMPDLSGMHTQGFFQRVFQIQIVKIFGFKVSPFMD